MTADDAVEYILRGMRVRSVGDLDTAATLAAREVEKLRTWRTPPTPSAKPDTLEACHRMIEYLDVEISGAVQDYLATKAELEAFRKREVLVQQALDVWEQQDDDVWARGWQDEFSRLLNTVRDFQLKKAK